MSEAVTNDLAARHAAAEATNRNFSYAKPPERKSGRAFVALAKTDCMSARVVVLKKGGGENILHYHDNGDSCWYVLKGRVRFYGPDDVLIGEFGANEGTCTPRFRRYWFENVGDDELDLPGRGWIVADVSLRHAHAADVDTAGSRRRRGTQDELGRASADVHDEVGRPDRKSTRLNSSHIPLSRMPSSA